ncbi:MAG TPA: uroporphyrinogen decarboxylase family protein [Victivallales bacterium]|nr:uroporphyrinogen decarboxylase family protein [Victivallales bacterium]
MTQREIFKANIEHANPPRPGIAFTGNRIKDTIARGIFQVKGYNQKRWTEEDMEYYDDAWGNVWARMTHGCTSGEVVKPAISDWDDLEKYQIPVLDYDKSLAECRKVFESAPNKFRIAFIPWMFSSARYMRKIEEYMMDMAAYPEELKKLHAKIFPVFESCIRLAAEAKADAIFYCEDMGTQNDLLFSPEMWDDYFGDHYRKLFAMAHELGMKVIQHSCGKNDKILERLLKAGVNCFQFDQPTIYDPAFLAPLLKKYKAGLYSPIDAQKILPTGDKKIIEEGVEFMFKHYSGFLMFKDYSDLPGIGVKPEWDQWAYEKICRMSGVDPNPAS